MAAEPAKILELREMITQKEGRHTHERFASSTLSCGVPRGALTEVSGSAKTEWLIQFLRENPSLKVFWAEVRFSLLPTALHQRGVDASRLLFAECGDELFSAVRMALRCQVFQCIVSPSIYREEKMLKALQLLAEKSNATVFLLTEELQSAWPIKLQFGVKRGILGKGFEIELKKNKGGEVSAPASFPTPVLTETEETFSALSEEVT
ncbi:MAG: hypothetical protein H7301_03140 [Cryobacterium sp.]|nr:hypothetical protein [Oligoflexia bacterium]